MQLDVTIQDERLQAMIQGVYDRLGHKRPAMAAIGEVVRTSIIRNFEAGGRPTRWPISKRAESDGGQTLTDTARLKNSLTVAADENAVAVGTNVIYARPLHFGVKKGAYGTVVAQVAAHTRHAASGKAVTVKTHTRRMTLPWGDIPARPFMLVQEEDWPVMIQQLADFIMGEAG